MRSHNLRMRLLALLLVFGCASAPPPPELPRVPYVVVLGMAQDGGYPQAGCRRDDCLAAFDGERDGALVASLGIVDPASGERWIIDATPDFPRQLRLLERFAGPPRDPRRPLDGVLLTHAHVGHYLGLAHLGREVMGTRGVPVYALPRMRTFLESNGPWSQLVSLGNIEIRNLIAGETMRLNDRISVTPLLVPHRDEFSETAGFVVRGAARSILWLPDIDKWEKWTTAIEDVVGSVDVAWIDATFYSADELPGRNLAEIPHPTVQESVSRLAALASRVRFTHLNQSNPLLRDPQLVRSIEQKGFRVTREGEVFPLE
jgi:pyrroloquinoline quinone biosynthesis protein B